ncbi:acyl-CoA dehydrogenase [Evansella cellulosilytica]|uniref:Acyl-CoA dehydrogenase n=1 Tax=Evansella cellulosilytica (strain ATCC 21833 / DSM 2522 / FERM P-1141 / JCM 9156 / N-4) TaxID=649639 RepID=E6TXE8_EVAC2|nr:acyl-CoA dehydrogenase [Evansella cellulosilytica]ADU32343.1 acyl-CoA dehydrogenase domain-containing protein [Evansella cellulosilytica DSM 2522]
MNLHFTEQQQMVKSMVSQFAKEKVAKAVPRMEKYDEFPVAIVKEMGQLGLMGIPIPEELGGSGMDFRSYIVAIHELAKVSATVGVILSVHTSVGTNPIVSFGTEKQKERFVNKLATGEFLGAFALTEPSAGSDAANIKTRAVKKGDQYILNGEKVFITNAGVADTYIVFAKTNPNLGSKGVTAFIVEKNTPGLFIGTKEKKMGLHGSNTMPIHFDDAIVPAENRLGEEGEGFKIALANLNVGRIGIAAQALGIAEAALEQATNYAKERKQFGKTIGSQQAIALKLADMATKVEAAKLLTYRAAYLHEHRKPCEKEVSMSKSYASTIAMEAATEAIQVFGGYGYTEAYPVERFFRDAKVTQIYEGTNEIQRIVISKQLLQLRDK